MTSKVLSAAATFWLSIAAMAGGPGAIAMAQQPTAKATLTVELVGFADTTGNATVCLFASEDAFKSVDLRKDRKRLPAVCPHREGCADSAPRKRPYRRLQDRESAAGRVCGRRVSRSQSKRQD